MRTRPAASVPMIAPMVLAAYNRPNDWLRCAFVVRCRVRVGSVAPIRIVAGASASRAIARRITARTCGAPSNATAISPYSEVMIRNVNGVATTTATSTSSMSPYSRSGARTRSATRPPSALPMAIPPKNPARIAETAWVVLPKTRTSCRDQTIS